MHNDVESRPLSDVKSEDLIDELRERCEAFVFVARPAFPTGKSAMWCASSFGEPEDCHRLIELAHVEINRKKKNGVDGRDKYTFYVVEP